MRYVFHFQVIWQNWGYLAGGMALTAVTTVISFLLGCILGVLGAVGRLSRYRSVRMLSSAYVEAIRNTPFLVQMYIIYYGIYDIGIQFSPIVAGCVALGINTGGYLTEIFRSGIQAVSRGLLEAAQSLALSPLQIFRRVVLPIATSVVYPALVNQFVSVLLGSSILSVITVHELTYRAQELASRNFRYFELFIAMGALYALLAAILGALLRFLGLRLKLQVRW